MRQPNLTYSHNGYQDPKDHNGEYQGHECYHYYVHKYSTNMLNMDSLVPTVKLIQSNYFIASIYLRDTYMSVAICNWRRAYLTFYWEKKTVHVHMLTEWFRFALRVVTKLMKPLLSELRRQRHICVSYTGIDDSYFQGETHGQCADILHQAIETLISMGSTIHLKSLD